MRLREYLNPLHGWKDSSDVEKVRVYTQQSFLALIVSFAVGSLVMSFAFDEYAAMACMVVSAAAAVVLVRRTPSLGGKEVGSHRVPLIVLAVASAPQLAAVGTRNELWVVALIFLSVAASIPLRLSIVAAVAAGAVVAITGTPAVESVIIGMFAAFMAVTVRLSMWLLRIVTELDATRDAAAALSVAEERLRFSRDLHDVVGRALSAIAVKSELAATLARRGDDRAATQMDEVRTLAQESMTDARRLVRGYRSIDVASELVGARSLLSAAGIRTELVGDSADVPESAVEQAAWVVREGVTNILRHSEATYCRIEFDNNSIRIVNDRPAVPTTNGDGTGLNGLRERLSAVGGTLQVHSTPETYTLAAFFSDSEAIG